MNCKFVETHEQKLTRILIPEDKLQERVAQLGEQLSRDYAGREIHAICILKGGVLFLADLIRHIDVPLTVDFMAVSSYGLDTESSGRVRILKDLDQDIQGKEVLIVEDIIDTGLTLAKVVEILETRDPASLKICTLLDKPAGRKPGLNLPIDYVGFSIPNRFVVGYGLDYKEYCRNTPYIFAVEDDQSEA